MMLFKNNINKYWKYLEQKYPSPRYVGKVKYLEFKDLKELTKVKGIGAATVDKNRENIQLDVE